MTSESVLLPTNHVAGAQDLRYPDITIPSADYFHSTTWNTFDMKDKNQRHCEQSHGARAIKARATLHHWPTPPRIRIEVESIREIRSHAGRGDGIRKRVGISRELAIPSPSQRIPARSARRTEAGSLYSMERRKRR